MFAVIAFITLLPLQLKVLNTTLRAAETPIGNFVIFGLQCLLSTLSIAICICKQNRGASNNNSTDKWLT